MQPSTSVASPRRWLTIPGAIGVAAMSLFVATLALGTTGQGVNSWHIPGASNLGKECSDLDNTYADAGTTWLQLKLEGATLTNGAHSDGVLTVTISNLTGTSFDWSSNIGVDAVVVKNGVDGANLYVYDGLSSPADGTQGTAGGFVRNEEETSDTNLRVPADNGISHISFCYDPGARKTGVKFNDLDADGVKDAGEPGLAGWTIYVDYNNNSILDANEPSGVTGDDGSYAIEDVDPGTWFVREVPQAGWTCSFPSPCHYQEAFVAFQTNSGNDFGNFQNATKSGVKFNDLDGDGVKDAGEPNLIGWEIHLFGTSGAGAPIHLHDTTDAAGYSFSVPPGTYTVCETQQAGWTQTFPSSGADCSAHGGGTGYSIVLTSGMADTDNHFGNFDNVDVTACKLQDFDGNLATTDDQDPIAGWTVHRSEDGVTVDTQLTGADGCYTWTNLGPRPTGFYDVSETVPAGWVALTPTSHNFESPPQSGASYTFTFINFFPPSQEGCTPGYWKQPQHFDSWVPTGYTTGTTLETVFNVPDSLGYDNKTLLEALSFKGGNNFKGAAQILLRAGVAALLNSASPDVDYALSTADVISQVNAALASGDRETILDLAGQLDEFNNARTCPLN
jgi:hypothetical protein